MIHSGLLYLLQKTHQIEKKKTIRKKNDKRLACIKFSIYLCTALEIKNGLVA